LNLGFGISTISLPLVYDWISYWPEATMCW